MKPTKKIYANKNDSCASIVNKVISSGLDELILYLPKKAVIAENPKNFKLLKREVASFGKRVVIESVDGDILEYASACGFEVLDGIFNHSPSHKSLADIVSKQSKFVSLTKSSHEESLNKLPQAQLLDKAQLNSQSTLESAQEDLSEEEYIPSRRFLLKRIVLSFVVVASIIVAVYTAFFILPTASISIERQKTEWSFAENVTASIKETAVSLSELTIPAQIFIFSKNHVGSFPATGIERIEKRAEGTITIWNAYSSERQLLVQNTRFLTPDDKIYRLIAPVTVPGAVISGGRIQASSIEARVIADAPGEEYNVGAIARLSIPGFRGSPRYNGFHGELKTGASGGLAGERKVPTADDISRAKEAVTAKVKASAQHSIATTIPPELKIIEGAITYEVTKEGVASDVNEQGEFSYGVIMEAKVPAYKESDLVALIKQKFQTENSHPHDLITKSLSYSASPTVDFRTGQISIPVQFTGQWARGLDIEAVRTSIIGVSEQKMRSAIFTIPGVLNVEANLWPFWVNSVPRDPNKIKIDIR